MHFGAWKWSDSNQRLQSNRTESAVSDSAPLRQLCHSKCSAWVMRKSICYFESEIDLFTFIFVQNFVHRYSKTIWLISFWLMWSFCPVINIRRMWSKSALVWRLLYKESKQWTWFVHTNQSKFCHLSETTSNVSFHNIFFVAVLIFRWLKRFCTGQFSNYVVQKLIEVVGISQVHLLYTKLEPHFNTMARHVCGRNIIDSLQGRLHELDGAMAMYFGQLGLAE